MEDLMMIYEKKVEDFKECFDSRD